MSATEPFDTEPDAVGKPLAADEFRARAQQLLSGPEIYFPIRHHSPSCAAHLSRLIDEVQPFAVLVEGPPSFDPLIEYVVHPEAIMPLAVYAHASFADGQATEGEIRIGSYYPLCDYSPELVALRQGHKVGARLGFLDLDHPSMARRDHRGPALMRDHDLIFSRVLASAADKLGCRDHNDLWDQIAEATTADTATFVATVAAYGTLARAGELQPTIDGDVATDGTTEGPHGVESEPDRRMTNAREKAMAGIVRAMMAEREAVGASAPIVVVTGAFHTVVLPELVARWSPHEAAGDEEFSDAGGSPELIESGAGLIRYSYDRLDELNGYAAGMPSPRWYQHVWEDLLQEDRQHADRAQNHEAAYRTLSSVAQKLRDLSGDGQPSVPSVADALTNSAQLQKLRGHQRISRCDVIDAAVSCFTKGEDSTTNIVRAVLIDDMRGDQVGLLPPGSPRSPLAADFDRRADALGLAPDTTKPKKVELDLYRSAKHRRISQFLHGISSLGIDYATATQQLRYSAATDRDVLREIWTIQFSPNTDTTLTEAAFWGSTIAEAVPAKLRRQIQEALDRQAGSGEMMQLVLAAAQRGVPDSIETVLDIVRGRLATDPSLDSVTMALREADLIHRSREPLEGDRLAALPAIAEQLFVRGCRLLDPLPNLGSDALDQAVDGVVELHRPLVASSWFPLDPSLFWGTVERVHRACPPGRMKGALQGLRWRAGNCSDEDLVNETAGHLADGVSPKTGAAYLSGIIVTAREVLWQCEPLLGELSVVIGSVDNSEFLTKLPAWRSAFSELTPREIDRVAELLRASHGIRASVKVTDLSEATLLSHLDLSNQVEAQLDADGLAAWLQRDDHG